MQCTTREVWPSGGPGPTIDGIAAFVDRVESVSSEKPECEMPYSSVSADGQTHRRSMGIGMTHRPQPRAVYDR